MLEHKVFCLVVILFCLIAQNVYISYMPQELWPSWIRLFSPMGQGSQFKNHCFKLKMLTGSSWFLVD